MAARANPVLRLFVRPVLALAAFLPAAAPAAAQTVLTLAEAGSRKGPDSAPAYAGEVVLVRGVVSCDVIELPYYDHVAIQDETGRGLVIEGAAGRLAWLRAGNAVEVQGTVANRAGLPVVMVSTIKVTGNGSPPAPKRIDPAGLNSFRYAGSLVAADGRVIGKGANTGGEYLYIGDRAHPLKVFLPRRSRGSGSEMVRFEKGDKVRAVGISSQHCPSPPYDTNFELVVAEPADIVLLVKRWPVSPELFFTALLTLASVIGAWWVRERRLAAQRATTMALAALGENLIGARSAEEALHRIARVLPKALRVAHVRLYLFDRASKTLQTVDGGPEKPLPVPLEMPETGLPAPAAACFRNRALFAIPNTRRSPFYGRRNAGGPRSVLLIPMSAQGELLGVLEIGDLRRTRDFTPDEQVAAQHLGNQVAISIKLMEQESMRQRLYRTEKLAAAGQLISGIAGEVRTPLVRILDVAGHAHESASPEARLNAVRHEARRASDILDRVVAFARAEPGEEKTIDLNATLRGLAAFRAVHWEVREIAFEDRLGAAPVWIVADPGQLERAFLDLLLDAERALADAPGRRIVMSSSILAGRVVVEIAYLSSEPIRFEAEPSQDWLFRHAMRSCGGEVRVIPASGNGLTVEVELPLAGSAPFEANQHPVEWGFTVLVVEPDAASRRALLDLLTARSCRVIPVAAAEQGIDMAARLRFDVIFCAVHLPGLSWVEFVERLRGQAGAFILLTEGCGAGGGAHSDGLVLQKPFRAAELDRLLGAVDARQPYPEHAAAK